MTDLPEFDNPPVVEVSIGVQFRPLFAMRGLALAALRERWGVDYPRIEEQSAIPSVVEGDPPGIPQLLFSTTPLPEVRQWFLNEQGTQLVQVQTDRLIVNWRAGDPPTDYPRYGHMRRTFAARFGDLAQFTADERLGELDVVQAELSYVNAMDVDRGDLGRIDRFLKNWSGTDDHHLGAPEQARMTLIFPVVGVGLPPVRMYVEVSPAQRATGEPVLFLTLTVRGNPGGRSLPEALKFLDEAHAHLVRSFAELTEESMHEVWGRRQ